MMRNHMLSDNSIIGLLYSYNRDADELGDKAAAACVSDFLLQLDRR